MPRRRGFSVEGGGNLERNGPRYAQGLVTGLRRALKDHGKWWEGQMAVRFRAPWVPYGTRNDNRTLATRSGAMRNSMDSTVIGRRIGDLRLKLFSNHPGAPLQEHGGIVRPRGKKYLAIPIDDNLTPAGVPRHRSPLSPEIADGRFVELGGDKLYYVKDAGAKGTLFLFAMRKSVDIPGPKSPGRKMPSRLGMRDTATSPKSRQRLRRRVLLAHGRAMQAHLNKRFRRG